jgi:hypothetical protein
VVDAVAVTLRLLATTLMAMRLQVAVVVADVVAVAAGEADAAVVASRRDKCSLQDCEHFWKAQANYDMHYWAWSNGIGEACYL